MLVYLFIGMWTYFLCALLRSETLQDADFESFLRGIILGIFFWPIVPFVIYLNKK